MTGVTDNNSDTMVSCLLDSESEECNSDRNDTKRTNSSHRNGMIKNGKAKSLGLVVAINTGPDNSTIPNTSALLLIGTFIFVCISLVYKTMGPYQR